MGSAAYMHDHATPENEFLREEVERTVLAAVADLPEEIRTALTLREIDGSQDFIQIPFISVALAPVQNDEARRYIMRARKSDLPQSEAIIWNENHHHASRRQGKMRMVEMASIHADDDPCPAEGHL